MANNVLPNNLRKEDGHGSNPSSPTFVTGDFLTDEQLRASPVPVSGSFTTTPSGTQDVNITGSTEIEVTLNGEPVELWRGGGQADALFVQWSGSQQVAVQGSVHVVTQGNNRLSVDAAQDGAWSVSIDNFPASQTVDGTVSIDNFPAAPAEYPLPAAQITALTPQTDALTNAELRASPVSVATGLTQPTTPADTQPVSAASLPLPTGAATAAKQLPDNHQVTVSNQITQPTTPSDTQPVSVASLPLPTGAATAAKQLPNNHDVAVSNFPAEYPLPAAQVSALTPQRDGLTDAELRAAPVAVENLAQLVPEQYDEIALSYTGDDLTGVVYKAATITVATLTLGYTSGKLTSVVRS